MQAGTKTIRIEDDVHKQLRLMALEAGEHVYEVVRRLVYEACPPKKTRQKERSK